MILPPFELQWIPCSTFRKHPAQWKEDVCSVLLKKFEAQPSLGPRWKASWCHTPLRRFWRNLICCEIQMKPFTWTGFSLSCATHSSFYTGGFLSSSFAEAHTDLLCISSYKVKKYWVLWLAWLGYLQLQITRIFKFAGQIFGPSNMFLSW